MLSDQRTYRVKSNKMPQELDLYAKHGLAPQVRHLGTPLAYLYGESGDIRRLVHLMSDHFSGPRALADPAAGVTAQR
jgi:hypothetical protein